jgi:hypothetical protein
MVDSGLGMWTPEWIDMSQHPLKLLAASYHLPTSSYESLCGEGTATSTVAFKTAIDPVLRSETHAFAQSSLGDQRLGVFFPMVNGDDRSFNQGPLQSDPLV